MMVDDADIFGSENVLWHFDGCLADEVSSSSLVPVDDLKVLQHPNTRQYRLFEVLPVCSKVRMIEDPPWF
jgi:hypothetical protein